MVPRFGNCSFVNGLDWAGLDWTGLELGTLFLFFSVAAALLSVTDIFSLFSDFHFFFSSCYIPTQTKLPSQVLL